MLRRMFCLLCAVLLLVYAVPAFSEETAGSSSFDFDLTFSLNPDAFTKVLRTRASGYASLINRLGLRGNLSWSTETESMDLDAVLYLTDEPSLTFPFRLYGTKERIFVTSPMMNNATVLLNMEALMEFAVKAKNTLGIPLPYFALLVPGTTEFAMEGLVRAWQDTIGICKKSTKISNNKFRTLSDRWQEEILNNGNLRFWISGLASGSEAPSVVESELNSLPIYYLNVTGGKTVRVTVSRDSQVWQNASGDILFSRQESEDTLTAGLSLPASDSGYMPSFSLTRRSSSETFSFDIAASVRRKPSEASSETDPDSSDDGLGWDSDDSFLYRDGDEEDDYDDSWDEISDDDTDDLPEVLLDFRADASGLPLGLPADSAFSLSASMLGAVYPNFSFRINGETKKDGALTLSLTHSDNREASAAEIFRCTGTVRPAAEPKDIPDYMQRTLKDTYNAFSFNERTLAEFSATVIPPLAKSVLAFIAAAPTAACQSFLDDLTDLGILDMLLAQ